jgi:ABC-type multidrug transport system permease subunit
VAVLLGLLWWQGKLETNANIQDQQGLLFYICIFWTTFSMWTTLMNFPMERQYLAKERAADMYRLSAYYLSSTICDGLAELVYPTLFLVILYFMAGLRRNLQAFFYTLLATFLIGITGQA